MEEYKQWLEQQIERCLNDKDLQREHWAFCKAYEKFTALRQPLVSGALPNDELIDTVRIQLSIIKNLISGKRVVNLDEAIAYYSSLVEKYGGNDR